MLIPGSSAHSIQSFAKLANKAVVSTAKTVKTFSNKIGNSLKSVVNTVDQFRNTRSNFDNTKQYNKLSAKLAKLDYRVRSSSQSRMEADRSAVLKVFGSFTDNIKKELAESLKPKLPDHLKNNVQSQEEEIFPVDRDQLTNFEKKEVIRLEALGKSTKRNNLTQSEKDNDKHKVKEDDHYY